MSNESDALQSNQNINQNTKENEVVSEKSKKKKKDRKNNDIIVLDLPEKLETLKGRIINCIYETLRQKPLIKEKDLILDLIFNCEAARKFYEENHETQYFRFLLYQLAKKKKILKVKIKGDDKHIYYLLPEQLDMFNKKS